MVPSAGLVLVISERVTVITEGNVLSQFLFPLQSRRGEGGGSVPIFDCLFISGVMLTGREDVMARREERGVVVVVEGELISHVTTQ